MNIEQALTSSDAIWQTEIIPTLERYIEIPNVSSQFDPRWKINGYMDRAVALFKEWAEKQPIEGLRIQVFEIEGKSPIILMEVPATDGNLGTVLLYGHLDKQPEMTGWEEGLGPWKPVRRGDRLYGRGGADDGYAMPASLTAIRLLQEQQLPYGRIVILIEANEESGSKDLPAYIDKYAEQIGTPELVICLDSGCGNYEQLWATTSLRGLSSGDLTVRILTEGVHSGGASGIVPDSFRIMRELLSRIENQETGEILISELRAGTPDDRWYQAMETAEVLGNQTWSEFPFVENAGPGDDENVDLVLQKTWKSTLTVIGVDGFPNTLDGSGNVLRPFTTLRLSIRTPPTCDAALATEAVKRELERNPPYGAEVTFNAFKSANGWNAPSLAPWLEKSTERASQACFGKPAMYKGEGGTIPFMGMLGEKFPNAQFLITGVLGPESNAHGPNEFLHVPMGVKLTVAVAVVITDHATK